MSDATKTAEPRVRVVGQAAADRLMGQIQWQPTTGVTPPSEEQVALVLHALADHTALQSALQYSRGDDSEPWPDALSLGRWLHDVGNDLTNKVRLGLNYETKR